MYDIDLSKVVPISSLGHETKVNVVGYEELGESKFIVTTDDPEDPRAKTLVYFIDLELLPQHELTNPGQFRIFFDPPVNGRKTVRAYRMVSFKAKK